jgi:hypothetical protein
MFINTVVILRHLDNDLGDQANYERAKGQASNRQQEDALS